jgi:hypothetical protein
LLATSRGNQFKEVVVQNINLQIESLANFLQSKNYKAAVKRIEQMLQPLRLENYKAAIRKLEEMLQPLREVDWETMARNVNRLNDHG